MNTTQFYGVHTALVTPMLEDGAVAYDELSALVERQVSEGINGLVAVGTTGESPTLDHSEHSQVIRTVAAAANGKVPVLAGTGSNSTAEAVSLTQKADQEDGVTGMLVVAPYYNKPSAEGLFRHFSAIAEVTEKPIILYSIPGRCGIDIPVDVCARLFEKHPNICGIKEAGGQAMRVADLAQKLGDDYLILSGDDSLTLPFMSFGAKGVISVCSNFIVKELVEMVQLALKNDFVAADKINRRFQPLFGDLFIQPNPVPCKTAMQQLGIISTSAVRLPLCEMTDATRKQLLATLEQLGL